MSMNELDGTKERKGKGKRVQEAGRISDQLQTEGIYREEQHLWASAKGAKVSLEGRSLRTAFLYQYRGSQERGRSPQPMTWQRKPYPTYSSLKVEMSTVVSCQIVLNPRHSHPKTKPNHPSNFTANITSSRKSSPVLTECGAPITTCISLAILQTILQLFPFPSQSANKLLNSKACDLFQTVPAASNTGQAGRRMRS